MRLTGRPTLAMTRNAKLSRMFCLFSFPAYRQLLQSSVKVFILTQNLTVRTSFVSSRSSKEMHHRGALLASQLRTHPYTLQFSSRHQPRLLRSKGRCFKNVVLKPACLASLSSFVRLITQGVFDERAVSGEASNRAAFFQEAVDMAAALFDSL